MMISRRTLLGGVGALAVPGAAWADCGEDERRRLLKLGDLLVPEAYACGGSAIGPVVNSAFLTADFQSPKNYPNGGVGQTIVSQRLWGASSGAAGDSNFGMMANSTITAAAAKINWGLNYFKNSGQQWWKSDLSVDTTVFNNLLNNFQKWDPLGISAIVVGADFNQSPFTTDSTKYATAMGNLAGAFAAATMPNGKKLPVIAMTANDEPDGDCGPNPPFSESTIVSYYNAMIPKIKAAAPNMMIWGPQTACFNSQAAYTNFITDCNNKIDIFAWDFFPTGTNPGPTDMSFTNSESGATFATASGLPGSSGLKAFTWGGNSISFDGGGSGNQADNSYPMAYACANWAINATNNASLPVWMCKWEHCADTINGFVGNIDVINSAGNICPSGWFQAQAVRKIFGPRWTVTANQAGLATMALTPSPGHGTLLVLNFGKGAQNSKQVAWSHWPVNTSGNGTANVWQLTTQSQTYTAADPVTPTTLTFTGGLSAPTSFPDPSITIISI